MHYPGYLRYFDSVVRLLAEQGHYVEIAFDSPDKQSEGIEALADVDQGVALIGQMPIRRGVWATVARGVVARSTTCGTAIRTSLRPLTCATACGQRCPACSPFSRTGRRRRAPTCGDG